MEIFFFFTERCFSIFCKIFDPDMSPLAFELAELYQFVTVRVCGEQGRVLGWLQALAQLGVVIPLDILFTVLGAGLDSLPRPHPTAPAAEAARYIQVVVVRQFLCSS